MKVKGYHEIASDEIEHNLKDIHASPTQHYQ